MIRVLICDDQAVVREGLRTILSTCQQLQVVGVANNGQEALDQAHHLAPDVVLMDLKMPVMNGVVATRHLTQQCPEAKVLVLTTYDADEWVFDAIRAGAAGYLLKDTPRDRLVEAIEEVAKGKTPVDPGVAGKLFTMASLGGGGPRSPLLSKLNVREQEILGLLAQGLSNAQIASRIYLSEGTVRNYVSGIFEVIGVADRTQAAILAIHNGLGR